MLDDGEHLTPLPVQPVEIPAAQWEQFKTGGDEVSLERIREQLEEG